MWLIKNKQYFSLSHENLVLPIFFFSLVFSHVLSSLCKHIKFHPISLIFLPMFLPLQAAMVFLFSSICILFLQLVSIHLYSYLVHPKFRKSPCKRKHHLKEPAIWNKLKVNKEKQQKQKQRVNKREKWLGLNIQDEPWR